MAAVLEILVFALVDPSSLHGLGGAPLGLGSTTVYSLAFFVFWAVIAAAAALTQLLCLNAGPDARSTQAEFQPPGSR